MKESIKGNLFFSHSSSFGHDISPETLLHKLAIKWFVGQTKYEVPNANIPEESIIIVIDKEKTKLEFRQFEKVVPDVILTTAENFQFAIEIFVTNDISTKKNKIIQQFGLPTLRVDLSDFYEDNKSDCRHNMKFIQDNLDNLMTDFVRKCWILTFTSKGNDENLIIDNKSNNRDFIKNIGFGVVIGFIILIWKILYKPRRFRKTGRRK